jgi:MFS superfamily sulfate permease-like transporter
MHSDHNSTTSTGKKPLTRPPRSGSAEQGGPFRHWKHDLPASLVVFLVALPLCLGIAIASGVPVSAGLITGIVGGIVVGLIGGSPIQVSGPAAGLVVIVAGFVQEHGLPPLGVAILIAGGLQLAAGLAKLAPWFRAVSPAVIHGMLAGIGVLILASQFHVMVDDKPKQHGWENLWTIPEAVAKGLPWPTARSGPEKAFRREMLVEVGALHRRQELLHRQVAEHLSDFGRGRETRSEESLVELLSSEQQQIADKLTRIVQMLDRPDFPFDGAQYGPALEAARQAIDSSATAREKFDGHQVRELEEATEAATESLAALLLTFKDHEWAAKIGLLTIACLIAWQSLAPGPLKVIPSPLVGVVVATTVAAVLVVPVLYIEAPDSLLEGIRILPLDALLSTPLTVLIQAGIVLAVVASAETLLCATAVDRMHSGPRTNYDRELVAQGVGNMICGVMGALPMTGVIVRSSANVQAGARTQLSAFLHGVWLLIFVAALPFVLRMIPTSSLAAILVYTGYKLVNIKAVKELWSYGKAEVGIYLATLVTIVATDLLVGVLVGIALAGIRLLMAFTHLKVRLDVAPDERQATIRLEGAATFVRLPILAAELERVPEAAELHVDFEHLHFIDHACLELIMQWASQHESSGGRLVMDWQSLHGLFRAQSGRRAIADRRSAQLPTGARLGAQAAVEKPAKDRVERQSA